MSHASLQHSGFSSPGLASQIVFRLVLDAMSRPGVVIEMPNLCLAPPAGMSLAAASLILTLADHETNVWLSPAFEQSSHDWVRFFCGSPISRTPSESAFALINCGETFPVLTAFALGEDCYPEKSTTLIVQCSALTGGSPVNISGPGVESRQKLAPTGLRPVFWQEAQRNNALFPRGIDTILVAGSSLVCLPRSTAISISNGDA